MNKRTLHHSVHTTITPQGNIVLDTKLNARDYAFDSAAFDERTSTMSRQLVNMQDEAVRRALIALGWKPPAGDIEPRRRIFPEPPPDPVDVSALGLAISRYSAATLDLALTRRGWEYSGHGIWKAPA